MSDEAAYMTAGARHKGRLKIAFGLTASYMIIEVIGGLATNSLALLSDAAHMATDVVGLGMALAAIFLAERSSNPQRTFGLYRLEVLAALANSVLLFGVGMYVLFEAYRRFQDPPDVLGVQMLVVAVFGLIVNVISFRLLAAGAKESLNVKGAYLEVLSDLLGSVGVIIAAIIIATTGWPYADAIIGAGIGLFILPRTYTLAASALRILLEIAPSGISVPAVEKSMAATPGVASVHDLHVWTLTSGMDAATAHITLADGADPLRVLADVTTMLREDYSVTHATIQCDPPGHTGSDTDF